MDANLNINIPKDSWDGCVCVCVRARAMLKTRTKVTWSWQACAVAGPQSPAVTYCSDSRVVCCSRTVTPSSQQGEE